MKILILGGTGAMGVPVTKILADRNEEVYITTRKRRESTYENVHYIEGNAQDLKFVEELLTEKWDCIIDFMVYSTAEFEKRYRLFLLNTKQYVFLSSSRVYAESYTPITEKSPRLLDSTTDEEYLQMNEYALEKARQENLLFSAKQKNWTIIRPYITYNDERMQLGVLEKEAWLYRALQGKSIVFSEDIAEKYTTLTHGVDVARRMVALIGNDVALGQVFHITANKAIKWKEVLEIYLDAIEVTIGKRPNVHWVENAQYMSYVIGNTYQVKYDRLYNRMFDNTNITQTLENGNRSYDENGLECILPKEGLTKCIESFIKKVCKFNAISWQLEGYHDRLTKEKTLLSVIPSGKSKLVYLIYRYAPISLLKIRRK